MAPQRGLLRVLLNIYSLSGGHRSYATVRKEGVEPSRPYGHCLLKTACLPFHHLRRVRVVGIEPTKPEATGLQPAETNQ